MGDRKRFHGVSSRCPNFRRTHLFDLAIIVALLMTAARTGRIDGNSLRACVAMAAVPVAATMLDNIVVKQKRRLRVAWT